ncbi:hypothetical protein Pint_30961 [Pistacia integerrima]|uniref:Uncharacterized protein n=1 Tax=Pistacia integerrima TaxID=434235 RepID=A0ACC0XSY5_9ROSI|nr:hypothetical protein Pint_30961 [Pistacia integerrima]
MARLLSILLLCVAFMLVLLAENRAATVEGVSSELKAQSNHGMYGTTPGSLHPQGKFQNLSMKLVNHDNVLQNAHTDAQPQHTRNHACSSAKNAVQSVCVCPLEPMATSKLALATTIGRPREEAPNALD